MTITERNAELDLGCQRRSLDPKETITKSAYIGMGWGGGDTQMYADRNSRYAGKLKTDGGGILIPQMNRNRKTKTNKDVCMEKANHPFMAQYI